MRKKWTILPTIFLIVLVCGITLLSSSKDPGIPPPNDCDMLDSHSNWYDAEIKIQVPMFGFESFRTQGNESYIPPRDRRYGVAPSAGGGSRGSDNYYVVVTVTSPKCSDAKWQRAMSPENLLSNGRMKIKVTPPAMPCRIKVEYYEVSEERNPYNANFNKPSSDSFEKKQLLYTAEKLYSGSLANDWDVINLSPNTFVDPPSPWNGELNKYVQLQDFQGVNDFIDAQSN